MIRVRKSLCSSHGRLRLTVGCRYKGNTERPPRSKSGRKVGRIVRAATSQGSIQFQDAGYRRQCRLLARLGSDDTPAKGGTEFKDLAGEKLRNNKGLALQYTVRVHYQQPIETATAIKFEWVKIKCSNARTCKKHAIPSSSSNLTRIASSSI